MNKILTIDQAIEVSNNVRKQGKAIVLAGGCFDILHVGHITFLNKAKEHGDILMVFLEHDKTIHKYKGANRPINTQEDRAIILSALTVVDYLVPLPAVPDDTFYDGLVNQIKPAIIATTKGDPNRSHKERQAKASGGTVVDVTATVTDQSTTRLIRLLQEDL